MKLQIQFALLAAALSVMTHTAHAESFRDRQIDERFAAADKNNDGKLTLDEARAGMPRVADNFDKIDSQKRGYVTLEQIKAAADK
ncbi:MAG: EF-hand domain-containing protein [Rhodocyclaceae bacterium]|jgi:hypothetical protein|nr:EF-hand domain-containing protein [Rhodocyclaceae bacterium]